MTGGQARDSPPPRSAAARRCQPPDVRCRQQKPDARGFTLVEVMVALVVVALGLAALMVAVSGTARTSGYLRDKTLAQWIAMNRLSEVRLKTDKSGRNTDTGELNFAGRMWHYDTRYFDTSIASMKRVIVRVYAGDAKSKGASLADATSFVGTTLSTPGSSNVPWNTVPGAGGVPGTIQPGIGPVVAPVPVQGSSNTISSSPTAGQTP